MAASKPEWSKHPHECYSLSARLTLAVLGSIVPIGCAAISSGILRQLDDGFRQIGWIFVGVVAVAVASWILGVVKATRSELKDLSDYALVGSIYPANTMLIYFLAQSIK